ncbi:MAG: Nif11-like leader peptide family natural product precursor [Bacillota bacterium]
MSLNAAREFLTRMNTDQHFRSQVENMELPEQSEYVAQAGYVFSITELQSTIQQPTDFLDQVIGGSSHQQFSSYETEYSRSLKDVLQKSGQ